MLTQTNRQEQERKSVEERSSAKKQDEDVEEDARSVPTYMWLLTRLEASEIKRPAALDISHEQQLTESFYTDSFTDGPVYTDANTFKADIFHAKTLPA